MSIKPFQLSMQEFILLIWQDDTLLSDEQQQARSQQLTRWIRDLSQQQLFVTAHAFWDYGYTVTGEANRPLRNINPIRGNMQISGYMIVLAKSIQEATSLAKAYPGINFGAEVEVRELR